MIANYRSKEHNRNILVPGFGGKTLAIWAAKHFLAIWAILFAVVMIVKALFGLSGTIWDIWYIAAAPFMFVWPLVEPIGTEYGETAARIVWVGAIAGIYIGLDVALWMVIRSVQRAGAMVGRVDGEPGLGLRGRIDLSVAWLVRYGLSLWAIVTAAALFFGFGFDMDFYEPNIKGLIFYGGLILSLPIWPLIYLAGQAGLDLEDPVSRGVALSCFVIACVVLDIARKHKRRRHEMTQHRQSPGG